MSFIETHPLEHSTIQSIHSEWDAIVKNPPYQRNGDIWSKEKKQLLIDSIINRYDIPKLYFHKYGRDEVRKTGKTYAIIDGRQRLETIISFIDNGFALGEEFVYLQDPGVKAAGMNYSELATKYPKIKTRFDSFSLPIVTVETDDLDLIDEMFSRLNEAVPLNAPEKRRAIGGDMVKAIDDVARHPFFVKRVKFSNKRYQHKEAAVRLLFISHTLRDDKLVDTKKPYLDQFAKDFRNGRSVEVKSIKRDVTSTLNKLSPIFVDKDPLLFAQAMVPIYFFVFRDMSRDKNTAHFTRTKLVAFNKGRLENRDLAATDLSKSTFELLEFDRLSQQGTNDASSIRERLTILKKWLTSH
jgi:hypothetical protein